MKRAPIRLRAGYALAMLFAVISIGGLTLSSAYARETLNWRTQAVAQDWFDLLVATPAVAITAWFASRGSRRARVVFVGVVLYAVYTLAIYCFAIHLNALFLVYCAAFGVALYTLISASVALLRETWLDPNVLRRTIGGGLIAIGVAFGALWLSQLVPAASTGVPPAELVDAGLLTNPIHVLDLAFVLPLHVIVGIALLRRRPIGYALAPALLAFVALMAGSIGFLQVFLELRGVASGGLPIAIAMATVTALSTLLLVLVLRKVHVTAT